MFYFRKLLKIRFFHDWQDGKIGVYSSVNEDFNLLYR